MSASAESHGAPGAPSGARPAARRRRPSLVGRLVGLAVTMGMGSVAVALCGALLATSLSRVGAAASFSRRASSTSRC